MLLRDDGGDDRDLLVARDLELDLDRALSVTPVKGNEFLRMASSL